MPSRRRRWRVGHPVWWGVFASIVLLAVLAYAFRASLLSNLARWWVVDEEAYEADAIVVLAGSLESRPFAAIELYHQKVAPLVLLTNATAVPPLLVGIVPSESTAAREVLIRAGVPGSSVVVLPQKVGSTYDEARVVRAWAEAYGARRIVVATDPFHTRRTRWIFERALAGTKTEVVMVATWGHIYSTKNWWRTEEGFVDFFTEVLKLVYYRLNY